MNNPYAMLVAAPTDAALLTHSVDRYSGVTVPSETLLSLKADETERFATLLAASMEAWTTQKRRGLWLQVPLERSAFIAAAAEHGFEFHHAQPKYVMLTCWLPHRAHTTRHMAQAHSPTDGLATQSMGSSSTSSPPRSPSPAPEASMIPDYANHSLGIGCLVLNRQGQCLVIQEKFAHPLLPDFWKLPGGAVDSGETLSAAAEREVLEETGVVANFRSIIGVRHLLNFRFGAGDLYFIAICTLVDESKFTPVAQPEEIAACKWWDLQEFLAYHSTRWMQNIIREPVIQEWSKLFPGCTLPPPPTGARLLELQTMPPHPKAAEGQTWPAFEAPHAPPAGQSIGMAVTQSRSALNSLNSSFYCVSPAPAAASSASSKL